MAGVDSKLYEVTVLIISFGRPSLLNLSAFSLNLGTGYGSLACSGVLTCGEVIVTF